METEATYSYPGSKGAPGVYHRIIREFPPHRTYIEPFAGAAKVFCKKRLAEHSHLVEIDPDQCERLKSWQQMMPGLTIWNLDALDWLDGPFARSLYVRSQETLIYADPPYLHSTLTSPSPYRYTLSDDQHDELLSILKSAARHGAYVAVSCYDNPLYRQRLRGWRKIRIPTMSRGGPRIETVYFSYRPPATPHDLRYLGRDRREREKLSRRRQNLIGKFRRLSDAERRQLVEALQAEFPEAWQVTP